MSYKIVIVDKDSKVRNSLLSLVQAEGFIAEAFDTAETAFRHIQKSPTTHLLITELTLPGIDGLEFIKKLQGIGAVSHFVIITDYPTIESAVEAIRLKVSDYLTKPLINDEIRQCIHRIFAQRQEASTYNHQLSFDRSQIIGKSPLLTKTLKDVELISKTNSNVLILGETGTGKELIAKAIHYNSFRANKPFVPINCSAIPDTLLESELFGYVKGAFTGAVSSKKGLFEEAQGGTVFLDEIGDLSPMLQVKLLRTLQDLHIRPVGSNQPIKIDVRFIFATNCDLKTAVAEKKFRQDLLYRINVLNIKLPALRQRKEDIPLLAEHFVKKFADSNKKTIRSITPQAMQILLEYDWPGNIRELQNVIERAVVTASEDVISEEQLPEDLLQRSSTLDEPSTRLKRHVSIEEYTKQFILAHQNHYSEQQIADMLGITRKALWEKRKRWNLTR